MYKEDLALNNLQWLICHKTPTKLNAIYLIYIYIYKEDLAFNNLQWLICHKTQPNHIYLIYMYKVWHMGQMVRVFANGLGDLGSVPGRVIPKTQKMVLDSSLLNTQHYKVRIKDKVEESREWSSTLPYTLV